MQSVSVHDQLAHMEGEGRRQFIEAHKAEFEAYIQDQKENDRVKMLFEALNKRIEELARKEDGYMQAAQYFKNGDFALSLYNATKDSVGGGYETRLQVAALDLVGAFVLRDIGPEVAELAKKETEVYRQRLATLIKESGPRLKKLGLI